MLVDKRNTPEVNDIVTFKLIGGEEIVGKLVEKTMDSVFVTRPVHIVLAPVTDKQLGVSMLPALGSVSDASPVQFPLAAMSIRPLKTSDDVRRNYIQATTNLITPPSVELR